MKNIFSVFFCFLIFVFGVSLSPEIHAQPVPKTFESLEEDLFPTWAGTKDIQNYLNADEKVKYEDLQKQIETAQKEMETSQKQVNEINTKIETLEKTKVFLINPQDYSSYQGYSDLKSWVDFLKNLVSNNDISSSLQTQEGTSFYGAIHLLEDEIIPGIVEEMREEFAEPQQKVNELKKQITVLQQKQQQLIDFKVRGVIGENKDGKLLMQYLPRLIDVLLKFVAPVVMVMFLYTGVRFIYSGDDEEDLTKSKQFFMYSLMGVIFIVLSYSIMKAVYFIFATS